MNGKYTEVKYYETMIITVCQGGWIPKPIYLPKALVSIRRQDGSIITVREDQLPFTTNIRLIS
jgi:hypothetical protein